MNKTTLIISIFLTIVFQNLIVAQTPTDKLIGDWTARNKVSNPNIEVDFFLIFKQNGIKTEVYLKDNKTGQTQIFDNFLINPDRTYSFKIIVQNAATMTGTGTFNENFNQMTGTTNLQGNGMTFNGNWTGRKIINTSNPNTAEDFYQRGLLLSQKEKTETEKDIAMNQALNGGNVAPTANETKAIADFTQALTLDSNHQAAKLERGKIYLRIGEREKLSRILRLSLRETEMIRKPSKL